MKLCLAAGLVLLLVLAIPLAAQQGSAPPAAAAAPPDYTGMYSFLKEGEYIQINLEDGGQVTGFISRYGETESDRGAFLNQFFKTAKLAGNNMEFVSQTVHGVWYEFKGAFVRGSGKNPGDEGYYVLKGTLTQNSTGADRAVSIKSQAVSFKAFPRNLDAPGH